MRILPALLLAAVIASPAHAALRYDFTATVTGIWTAGALVGSSDLSGTLFQLNDAWTGSFVIDDNMRLVQSTSLGTSTYNEYQGYRTTTIANAATGFSYISDPNLNWLDTVYVSDMAAGQGVDNFKFTTVSTSRYEMATLHLQDSTATVLNSAALPTILELGDWDQPVILTYTYVRASDGLAMSAYGTLDTLRWEDIGPVPEPSTYAMLGLGLAAMAMAKRLRRA